MTYKIKTHNPWLLILIVLVFVFIPISLLNTFGEGVTIIGGFISVSVGLILAYKFLGKTIHVELSDNGVGTTWATAPFFTYSNQFITWDDILWWNFKSYKMADVFSIKTRTGQTLYIRCLDLYSSQRQLNSFLEAFRDRVDHLNKKTLSATARISPKPSIYEKPIGRVFAVLILIVLIFLTYKIKTQGLGSIPVYNIALVYVGGIFWIAMTAAFYFVRRTKKDK